MQVLERTGVLEDAPYLELSSPTQLQSLNVEVSEFRIRVYNSLCVIVSHL